MTKPKLNFYGVNIEKPQSDQHDKSRWQNTVIGKLYNKTGGNIFVREIPYRSLRAEYGWKITDAYFSHEDSLMTYFRAYDLEGRLLTEATFGVHWNGSPHRIAGGFKYRPEFRNEYYLPVKAELTTPNTGGYTVQVLDRDWPSEGLAFGMYKSGEQHQSLVISFRLFKLDSDNG